MSDWKELTQLRVEVGDHIAVMTLDSPPVNAMTRALNDELTWALDRVS